MMWLERLRAVHPGYWLGLGGAILLLALRRGAQIDAGPIYGYPSFVTGRRLTNASVSGDGLVYADPYALASQADVDVETYTVARTLASEAGSGPAIEKAAIAWAIRNERDAKGTPILTLGTTKSGFYGRQARVGFMATSKDPTDKDLHVATMVLAATWPDPAPGARRWFHPADQDAIFAQGGTSYDAATLIEKRRSEGWFPVTVSGAPRIVMFRRA